ncbi:hypothetical protein K458DRAFT_364904 [Lentithecium fluviatile CBS 122367]|uniref:Zn(2)-C6 fungal-type domain-containing protein n=1 Tax=Lentithecium fluviatile CBS 122367 TaxID=1168545 RepID=A0A6G1J6I1_9PLEO|nr:hypothetical protein K458DRAFT_364904 [Lentithecium fluviatile CBS 122367]
MGKYRSKSGCQTCRQRRVKCDEARPTCGQCSKKTRDCQWEAAHARFRGYRPTSHSSETTPSGFDEVSGMEVEEDDADADADEDLDARPSASASPRQRGDGLPEMHLAKAVHPTGIATAGLQQTSPAPYLPQAHVVVDGAVVSPAASTSTSGGGVSIPSHFSAALPTRQPTLLSTSEGALIRHYVENLGRWLDGTDPARQFTLRVPMEAKHCPILLHAIQSFAARHRGDDAAVDDAYERCITLLIERLNLNIATHDDDLLCAIVILHFFEQLNVSSSVTETDNEQHLTGSSAILRASQTRTVDPSAPTLREAAFWIYVRQCLFKSTIDQQPPNIDFALRLHPVPCSMRDHYPLAQLRLETAWANQMTWHCACVANFCFDQTEGRERAQRMQRWQELWDAVAEWKRERPASFDPLWSGLAEQGSTFPGMLFGADWHVVASVYFHFSCILLLTYKPGPKFAIRSVQGKLSETDTQILEHARETCGNCKSSPSSVPSLIILCHTIFIWGPLLFDAAERDEVLELFATFQRNHKWPTAWIIKALRVEWGME